MRAKPLRILAGLLIATACRAEPQDADGAVLGGESAAETSTETNASSITESSASFVPKDDTVSAPQCDPFVQDCEPGEKCVPYGTTAGNWEANKCVPVLGDGTVGEPCTHDGVVEATDSCDATSICWNVGDVDGEAVGTCAAFCTGTSDDPICPTGSSCSINSEGIPSVCNVNCNPLIQDCLGTGCYWSGYDFQCVSTTSDLEEGQACGYINDCKPGLMCIDAEVLPSCDGATCCSAYCDLGLGGCAVAGTQCLPLFDDNWEVPGYEQIGLCMVPPG